MSILFSRLVIIGVGLLGASIGLAAKKNRVVGSVVGIGRNRQTLGIALQRGALDIALTDWNTDFSHQPTLVVVCTPVSTIPEMVDRAVQIFGDFHETLITDVGSTKETICRRIADPRFIGSHPIAGSEKTGPEFADAELFQGRTTILTPTKKNREDDIQKIEQFWQSLGSSVVRMEPRQHDEILAVTSHLPHAVSATLNSILTDTEKPFTGTGFKGMTRLAAGSPEVWTDILTENRDAILAALSRFNGKLQELAAVLESRDAERIKQFLENAASQ